MKSRVMTIEDLLDPETGKLKIKGETFQSVFSNEPLDPNLAKSILEYKHFSTSDLSVLLSQSPGDKSDKMFSLLLKAAVSDRDQKPQEHLDLIFKQMIRHVRSVLMIKGVVRALLEENNSRFRECVLKHPLLYGIEDVVDEYCVSHQSKEDREFHAELKSAKQPRIVLNTLVDLGKNQTSPSPNLIKYINAIFSEKAKMPEFREYITKQASSPVLEKLLFDYCCTHYADKEMLAVYLKMQPHGEKIIHDFHKNFLKEHYDFSDPLKAEEKDLIEIAYFLMDSDRLMRQLKKLDGMVQAKALKMGLLSSGDAKSTVLKGYVEGKPFKDNKLLSSVIYSITKEAGFQFDEHEKPIKLYTLLSSAEFYEILAEKRLFKDVYLGGQVHGEWVHAIQWICIILEYQEKKDGFLKNKPVDIYSWIGAPSLNLALWSKTFDTIFGHPDDPPRLNPYDLNGTPVTFDCRAYQEVNGLLIHPNAMQTLPFLHQTVTGRSLKRLKQKGDSTTISVLRGLCRDPGFEKNSKIRELAMILEDEEPSSTAAKNEKQSVKLSFFKEKFNSIEKDDLPEEFVDRVKKSLGFG